MSTEFMAFILGGLLIAAAVFGGGLEIKELKLPQLVGVARFVCAGAGLGFIALAVWLQSNSKTTQLATDESVVTTVSDPFVAPKQAGERLDYCLSDQTTCGEQPATQFCAQHGYTTAKQYPNEKVEGIKTRFIDGSDQGCEAESCVAFSQITCEK